MGKKVLGLLLLVLLASGSLCAEDQALVDKAKGAVALLYAQDSAGAMDMRCTATAFEKTETGFLFVSAAHCVGNDDTAHERSAPTSHIPFYLTFDEAGDSKTFYRATAVWVGYQHRGEDFSVFSVTTTEPWATIPLGDERKEKDGAAILNLAGPLGLGLQVFRGSITSLFLDRPVVDEHTGIDWQGSMRLQLSGTDGGSSGSAIVSEQQHAIIGFLVGSINGSTIIAVPISKFSKVHAAVLAGKYRYYKPGAVE